MTSNKSDPICLSPINFTVQECAAHDGSLCSAVWVTFLLWQARNTPALSSSRPRAALRSGGVICLPHSDFVSLLASRVHRCIAVRRCIYDNTAFCRGSKQYHSNGPMLLTVTKFRKFQIDTWTQQQQAHTHPHPHINRQKYVGNGNHPCCSCWTTTNQAIHPRRILRTTSMSSPERLLKKSLLH